MATSAATHKPFVGTPLGIKSSLPRKVVSTKICAYSGKGGKTQRTDLKKQGLNSIKNTSVRNNLMGISKGMETKGWVDAQGRKGKGLGVYRFSKKYGSNVDGFSPIFTPDIWSESGESYSGGTEGILLWIGLLGVGLAVAAYLIISTSQI